MQTKPESASLEINSCLLINQMPQDVTTCAECVHHFKLVSCKPWASRPHNSESAPWIPGFEAPKA